MLECAYNFHGTAQTGQRIIPLFCHALKLNISRILTSGIFCVLQRIIACFYFALAVKNN